MRLFLVALLLLSAFPMVADHFTIASRLLSAERNGENPAPMIQDFNACDALQFIMSQDLERIGQFTIPTQTALFDRATHCSSLAKELPRLVQSFSRIDVLAQKQIWLTIFLNARVPVAKFFEVLSDEEMSALPAPTLLLIFENISLVELSNPQKERLRNWFENTQNPFKRTLWQIFITRDLKNTFRIMECTDSKIRPGLCRADGFLLPSSNSELNSRQVVDYFNYLLSAAWFTVAQLDGNLGDLIAQIPDKLNSLIGRQTTAREELYRRIAETYKILLKLMNEHPSAERNPRLMALKPHLYRLLTFVESSLALPEAWSVPAGSCVFALGQYPLVSRLPENLDE